MAAQAAPMLAMAWLERVLDTYRSFGLTEECEAIEVRLRELGPGAVGEMKRVSTPIRVPTEDVERFLAALTTGTLQDVLFRLAAQFVPTKKELGEEVRRLAKLTPLSAVFTQKIMDWEGRPVAEVGSVEDDLEGHLVRRASQNMQFEAPWLRAVMERLLERLQPTVKDLRDHLLAAPVFDARRAPILERGLAAYLGDEGVVAAPVLIPQVEDAMRSIVRLSGGSTYRPHRRGGLMLKTFDDLLREEAVVKTLGESVVHYFQVLFTDQRGWNIRNEVCHGISPLQAFSWPMTDRIFHALLILATVREREGEREGQQ
jgi:hypothetical protein